MVFTETSRQRGTEQYKTNFFSTFLFNVVRASDKNEKFAKLRDIRGGPSEMAKKYDNKLLV